ncbi:MAG: DPP IV N-terminal domain-containing protein, partial [Bacteroidales bacterium]|nr:DPP IV N-terminal domain-containing protein [Bacteroidales bacterium]
MKKLINIFLIISLVVANATIANSQTGSKKITLEDVIKNYQFFPKSVYGIRSMNVGVTYTTLENNTMIVKHSYKTGEVLDTIINLGNHSGSGFTHFSNYSFSDDESKILLTTNRKQIFRHSFTAEYYIYYIEAKLLQALSKTGKQQLATFSPDGNNVAFVRENNLFINDLITYEERQITDDGKHNHIINGAPDWVYEEEFGFSKGFEWSPDGKSIAFMKFDEAKVKEFSMTVFSGQAPEIEENKLYPENRSWKYPKAGEDNSLVSVHVYNLMDGKISIMDLGQEKDQYIPRIKWTNNPDLLCVYRLNRLQNKLELLI